MNTREFRNKFEQEFDNEYKNILRIHKKNQKCMAPLVFPILEREKRIKQGFHLSEVSTPQTITDILSESLSR